MVVVVDYGVGNLGSIKNMLMKIGVPSEIGSDRSAIEKASRLILPGVGAFDTGMDRLRGSGLIEVLERKVLEERTPILGICLGAQMMTRRSEEGSAAGLGWLAAETRRIRFDSNQAPLPLPNVGWRDVDAVNGYPMLTGYDDTPRFYFVHSYYLCPDDDALVSMRSVYGFTFACGLALDNIHCAQFHPEKSHRFGMQFLRNFIEQTQP